MTFQMEESNKNNTKMLRHQIYNLHMHFLTYDQSVDFSLYLFASIPVVSWVSNTGSWYDISVKVKTTISIDLALINDTSFNSYKIVSHDKTSPDNCSCSTARQTVYWCLTGGCERVH